MRLRPFWICILKSFNAFKKRVWKMRQVTASTICIYKAFVENRKHRVIACLLHPQGATLYSTNWIEHDFKKLSRKRVQKNAPRKTCSKNAFRKHVWKMHPKNAPENAFGKRVGNTHLKSFHRKTGNTDKVQLKEFRIWVKTVSITVQRAQNEGFASVHKRC